MLHLDLDDVQAGMVLAKDVLGVKGQLLLSAGATLTGNHLDVLRAHSVRRVVIHAVESAITAPVADMAVIDAQLEAKFRLCSEQHPLIHELRRLCRDRLSRKQGDDE